MLNIQKLEQEGTYQDIEIGGKTIVKGLAPVDCNKRWNQFKSVLRGRNVILEVGSDTGFFTKRIAKEFPTSIILSFEESDKALIQKELLKAEGIKNVLLFHQKFWLKEMRMLAQSCEAIDTIIFMSVFHHYPPEESLEMLDLIFKNIPAIITEHPVVNPVEGKEFPDRTDDFVQNQYSNFEKEINKRFQYVQFLGQTTLDGVEDRKIFHSYNPHLVRPSLASVVHKEKVTDQTLLHNKLEYWHGHWTLYRKYEPTDTTYTRPSESWKHGFSAYDAHQFNLIYPEKNWWKEDSEIAYGDLIEQGANVTEIGPTNLIFTTGGLQVIDWDHNNPDYYKGYAIKEVDKLKNFYDSQ
jgi:hypothetical protein